MTLYFCDKRCKISSGGAGEFDDQNILFKQIKVAHKNCPGFQIGMRKLKGKSNWGHTEIEKMFTDYMIKNYDEMLHEVIASYKPGKVCLIKDKWKWMNPK
jgi:hypothetical protein